jgi:predicted dehydrogenase
LHFYNGGLFAKLIREEYQMAKTVNVALIGTKFMGKAHSNGFLQAPRFFDMPVKPVMKVICGNDPKGTKAAAEQYGWQEASTNWEEVINRPDIDVIDIATPGDLHATMAIAAAKAGKHIICEKPLANTLKEAQSMLAAVQKAGVKHMCGFTYRFNPAVQTIKKMVSKGELGRIFHVRACYQQDWIVDPEFPVNWRLQKATAGSGALGDIGAHISARWRMRRPPLPTRARRRPARRVRWTWTTRRCGWRALQAQTHLAPSRPRASRRVAATTTASRFTAARAA